MKKMNNKQAKRASKLAKAENLRKKEQELINKIVNVKNAEGDPDTVAEIVVQNQINFEPKVSVIIPVYNVEPYLRECLDSVVNQTLQEIEIICVDDGSTDKSLDILLEYAKKDKRITVLKQENLHAGVARNAGLAVAKGEYLSFLDSDDFFELNMLEEMYKKAIEDESDVVICGFWAYDNQQHKNIWQKNIDNVFINASPFLPAKFKDTLFFCSNPNPWTKLFKHQLFLDNNLYFEKFEVCNDFTCIYTALAVSNKISTIKKAYIHYRTKQQNNLSADRHNKVECFLYATAKLEKNLLKKGLYETFIIAYKDRVLDNFKWETAKVDNIQQKNLFLKAQQILSQSMYNLLFPPKISVIIPIYNTEKYIEQCLNSIINQTLKDIEIICVDDGSTDKTLSILQKYAKKDSRIKIYQQNHKRAGAARNFGAKKALGKYIYFIDSDDWIELSALEKLYNKIEEDQSDICIYGLDNYDDLNAKFIANKYLDMSCFDSYRNKTYTYLDIKQYIFRRFGAFFHIYNKNFFITNNLYFQEDIIIGEDVLPHVKSVIMAKKISFLHENLYHYRINRIDSVMYSAKNNSTVLDIFSYIKEVEKFLIEINVYSTLELYFIDFIFEQFLFHFKRISNTLYKKKFIANVKSYIEHLDKFKIANSAYALTFQNLIKDTIIFKSVVLSVIIPIYNTEKYLSECLDSVLNQTFKDIEIICVNDGSPDNSLKILTKYAAKDCRIKIINQKNQGVSCSRNNAMKIASGKYFVFLDSDDYIRKDALEKIYAAFVQNDLDMLSFSGINFDDNTNIKSTNRYWEFSYLPTHFDFRKFNYKQASNFLPYMHVSSCLTVYKASFIKNKCLRFPDKLCFEDNLFFHKSILNANFCGIIKDKLYYRRVHSSSITQNWKKHFYDYLTISDMVLEYVKNTDITLLERYKAVYLNNVVYRYNSFPNKYRKKYEKQTKFILKKYGYENRTLIPPFSPFNSYLKFPYYLLATPFLRHKKAKLLEKQRIKSQEAAAIKTGRAIPKKVISYKLFNFVPVFSVKQRGGRKIWSLLGIPFWKKRITDNGENTKYYLLGIPLMRVHKESYQLMPPQKALS